jgi:hypothetical protein
MMNGWAIGEREHDRCWVVRDPEGVEGREEHFPAARGERSRKAPAGAAKHRNNQR